MAWKTCYQPHAADPTGPVVAHAVSNENPNVSVAGEQLRNPIADEDWPGNGPPCSSAPIRAFPPRRTADYYQRAVDRLQVNVYSCGFSNPLRSGRKGRPAVRSTL